MKDVVLRVENRPGALAEVCEIAGKAGINLDGGCGFVCEGQGVFHILVEELGAIHRAIAGTSLTISEEREVLLIDMDDKPGALGEILRHIADAGVNVDVMYLATRTRVAIVADDPRRATAALL